MPRALRPIALGLFLIGAACGRTGLPDDAPDAGTGGSADASARLPDAGSGDAGSSDAGAGDAGVEQAPIAIYVARGNGCPATGSDTDMRPAAPANQLLTANVSLQDECSGAGGEWIVAQSVTAAGRLLMLGNHACYYLRPPLQGMTQRLFGVVRFTPNTGSREGPTGWCITAPDGSEPVRTADTVAAIALFRTREGADAARARWSR